MWTEPEKEIPAGHGWPWGPGREALIAKGMIYNPGYGHASFIIPLLDDFMRRIR